MTTLYSLKTEKEVKIIRAIIEELKAENQAELLKIRILDQIASKHQYLSRTSHADYE